MMTKKTLGLVGLVARFRPLHIGGARMLDSICEQADHVYIGIGSVNKYSENNPFTYEETKITVETYLKDRHDNYSIHPIEDSAHIPEFSDGKKWVNDVQNEFGKLDLFVSGNPWVKELLNGVYDVVHPASIIPKEKHVKSKGSIVRYNMAKGSNYESFIPLPVLTYMNEAGLITRFQKEFGLATLMNPPQLYETQESEQMKVRGTGIKETNTVVK